jgi:HlyD family secretion protein
MKSKHLLIGGLTLALVGVVGYGISGWLGQSDTERYKTQAVEQGEVAQNVSANGTLNPVTLVSVGTQVSGTVKRLLVDYNSKVEKNQVLAELDDTLLAAQAGQDAANLRSAKASLELAVASEKRMQALFAQDYVARQDLDQAVQTRKSAQAAVEQQQAALAKSRANVSYAVIRSPVSGTVVDRQVDIGQTVAASFQTPTLFKIAQDLTKMQIDSAFAEADIGQIKEGQPVRFNVDAFPNRTFHGVVKVIRLNPTTTSNVVTYDVVISVDNPDQILLPGMTAYVNINVAKKIDVLLVSNAALRFKPLDPPKTAAADAATKPGEKKPDSQRRRDPTVGTVWVLEGDKLHSVPVKIGITDGRNTEIVEGALKAGDKLVVAENSGKSKTGSGSNGPPGPQFRPF